MKINRRTMVVGSLALAGASPAFAAWPTKPLRMIVPYPAGGATDVIGRLAAAKLAVSLGQPVVVENRSGASGNIGAQEAARDKSDAHTLLMGAITSHAIMATLAKGRAGFDLMKDFAAIDVIGEVPLTVVVHSSVPANNFAELVAYAKANPGKLSFASGGTGGPQRMGGEVLMLRSGIELLHVPYKGSAPAMADLMGGQVNMMVETVPSALPHIQSGKLRALAVTSRQRLALLPNVPTLIEAGGREWADFEMVIYYGILMPSGAPAEAVNRLSTELGKVMKDPEFQARLLDQGIFTLPPQTPSEAATRVRNEVVRWEKVIQDAKLTLEN